MKSDKHGASTSQVEILNVSPHGLWIMVKDKEYFMDYKHFPWFFSQSIDKIFNVKFLHGSHLYWEELDIDLELDCIENPEKYPLKAI